MGTDKGKGKGKNRDAGPAFDVWGPMETPQYELVSTRTKYWTDELVRGLDDRNVQRLKCLPAVWQNHVVWTYAPEEGKDVRNSDKHINGTITGVRKLVYRGITAEEALRLQGLAGRGVRISYNECTQFRSRGKCQYGDSCRHPHVF